MKPGKLKHDVPALLRRLDDAGIEVTDAFSLRTHGSAGTETYLVVPKKTSVVCSSIYEVANAFVEEFPQTKIRIGCLLVEDTGLQMIDHVLRVARASGVGILGVKLRHLGGYDARSLRFYRLLGVSVRILNDEEFSSAEKRLLEIWNAPEGDPEFQELSDAIEAYQQKHHPVEPPTAEEAARFREEQERPLGLAPAPGTK